MLKCLTYRKNNLPFTNTYSDRERKIVHCVSCKVGEGRRDKPITPYQSLLARGVAVGLNLACRAAPRHSNHNN